jgi:hypothetical protein
MSELSEAKSLKDYVRKNHPGFKNVQTKVTTTPKKTSPKEKK